MEQEKVETLKTALLGQALLYSLLGKTIYTDPDQGWLKTLIDEDVFAEAPFGDGQAEIAQGLAFLQKWANKNREDISEDEFSAIKNDHLYLFIGVGKSLATPWGSVYYDEKRLLFQESTLKVRNWYSRYGLQMERLNREPDDHIGLELTFTAHLATLAMQALNDQDQARFQELINAQYDFLSENLFLWAPTWCDLVNQHSRTDFYRGIALLVNGALKETELMLKQILAESSDGDELA